MVDFVLLCLLCIATLSSLSAVVFAVVALRRVSAATALMKRQLSQEPTVPSLTASAIAEMQTDQAALFSTLESLTTTVKRLSSRAGMRDLRARAQESEAPPVGAGKAELLRHYGMAGKVGPDFARAQQALELKQRTN